MYILSENNIRYFIRNFYDKLQFWRISFTGRNRIFVVLKIHNDELHIFTSNNVKYALSTTKYAKKFV